MRRPDDVPSASQHAELPKRTSGSSLGPVETGAGTAWVENDSGDRFPVESTCSIGRSDTNQIHLPNEKVSRRHAIINAQAHQRSWITDLGSSNGTYLNGRRVAQSTRLYDQDRISIGKFGLLFRQPLANGQPRSERTITQVTIREVRSVNCWLLVADLESSTRLAQTLAPEQIPLVTGQWLETCRDIIEQTGGCINKYLGDGFLAYWHDGSSIAGPVARALKELQEIQSRSQPAFRVVLHYGPVTIGGALTMGEESLMGAAVNFVFRMEKLCASLKLPSLVSESAQASLESHLATIPVGRQGVSGFEGEFPFFKI